MKKIKIYSQLQQKTVEVSSLKDYESVEKINTQILSGDLKVFEFKNSFGLIERTTDEREYNRWVEAHNTHKDLIKKSEENARKMSDSNYYQERTPYRTEKGDIGYRISYKKKERHSY